MSMMPGKNRYASFLSKECQAVYPGPKCVTNCNTFFSVNQHGMLINLDIYRNWSLAVSLHSFIAEVSYGRGHNEQER